MPEELLGQLDAADVRVAVVVSRFNDFLTEHLLKGAIEAWTQLGGDAERLTVVRVPGAFELPVTALHLAQSGRYAAIVCLGCVIRGETSHFDHVCEQAPKGVREVGTATGVPCIFGVLTCDTMEQALQRAGVKLGNSGRSAMLTAIEMASLVKKIDRDS